MAGTLSRDSRTKTNSRPFLPSPPFSLTGLLPHSQRPPPPPIFQEASATPDDRYVRPPSSPNHHLQVAPAFRCTRGSGDWWVALLHTASSSRKPRWPAAKQVHMGDAHELDASSIIFIDGSLLFPPIFPNTITIRFLALCYFSPFPSGCCCHFYFFFLLPFDLIIIILCYFISTFPHRI